MALACKEQPALWFSQHQRLLSTDQSRRSPALQSKSSNGCCCCCTSAWADARLATKGVTKDVAADWTDAATLGVEVCVADAVLVVCGDAAVYMVEMIALAVAVLVVMFVFVVEVVVMVVPVEASLVFEFGPTVLSVVVLLARGDALVFTLILARITGVVVVAVVEPVLCNGHPSCLCLQHHACSPGDQALPSWQSNGGRRQAEAGCGAQPRFSWWQHQYFLITDHDIFHVDKSALQL